MLMALITFERVSYHYDTPCTDVFANLTLAIDTTWRTALIGRNGKGKTTLLHLLRGALPPTRGQVMCPCAVRYFPYTPSHSNEPTAEVIKECVAPFRAWERRLQELQGRPETAGSAEYSEVLEQYQRQGGYDIAARIERECAELGIAPRVLQQSFSTLSGGEQTRALMVALFLRADAFPLIDEPTDHLDMAGRALLGAYLARKPGFVLVSHDRHFLDQCVDHVISIERATIRVTQGDYSAWRHRMEVEEAHEQRRDAHLRQEIKALRSAARKRRTWSDAKEKSKRGAGDKGNVGHKAAKLMKRALGIERRVDAQLEEKEGLLRNVEKERVMKLTVERGAPERVVAMDHVTVSIDGRDIVRDFSLSVDKGERVALVGPNGCGKTTVLRAMAGEIGISRGTLHVPGFLHTIRSYQNPLWDSGTLRDHLKSAGIDETRFRNILGCLGVSVEVFDRPLETFSRGECKKIDLCRSFLEPAHLLLWDEPLNYVDMLAREQIECVVLASEPTLVFVEHDQWFVERVATRIVSMA